MLIYYILVLLSLVVLYYGAESLVRGSASLSIRLGLTPLIVGLTVVAFGTSAPELVVSLKSVFSDKGDIAVGNAIGSNIFNIGMILGITAIICPLPVKLRIIQKDMPIMLIATLVLVGFLWDSYLALWEGIVLFGSLLSYIFMNVQMARQTMKENAEEAAEFIEDAPELLSSWVWDAIAIVFGGLMLVLGSEVTGR